jgi:hypothetical protein
MGHLETIYATGDDALGNEGILTIGSLPAFFTFQEKISLRVTTMDIPDSVGGTYTIDFRTQKLEKPSGKIDTATEFTINFRADKYMAVYQAVQAWHQAIYNNNTGAIMEDASPLGASNFRTDLNISMKDSNGVLTYAGWDFIKAYPKSVGALNFDQSNGEPLLVPITFSFIKLVPAIGI